MTPKELNETKEPKEKSPTYQPCTFHPTADPSETITLTTKATGPTTFCLSCLIDHLTKFMLPLKENPS